MCLVRTSVLRRVRILEAVKTGEVQVEQDHFRRWMLRSGVFIFSKEVIKGLPPIVQHKEIIGDLRPVQVLFDEPGVSGVVFNHQDKLELTLNHVTMTFSRGPQARLVHRPLITKFPGSHSCSSSTKGMPSHRKLIELFPT